MNLVAKEFVACQPEQDPGVLILSPFAGAGGLMQEALQVNFIPWKWKMKVNSNFLNEWMNEWINQVFLEQLTHR